MIEEALLLKLDRGLDHGSIAMYFLRSTRWIQIPNKSGYQLCVTSWWRDFAPKAASIRKANNCMYNLTFAYLWFQKCNVMYESSFN